ncbi:MAG TPA: hypothetical protein VLM86_01235 [Candidatus Bathyarchaeia archaeon]|nr:hypothetical protein [Candidatus Bathyarchaeia archaeon]
MTRERPIRPEMFLGEVIRQYPSVRGKIKEFFGAECLRCESNEKETIHYTSWHRGLDPKQVCRELNTLLKAK